MIVGLLLALASSGCLIVTTTGDGGDNGGEPGIEYTCDWLHNGVRRHEEVCGPAAQDPDYVIAHFPFERSKGDTLTCTATSKLCWFRREGMPDPTEI